ncbi:MAG: POT family MFS transporter [Opitutae bacterium]|jgi:proton-dependent oligopeptide transporter, POT family|nr:POT family MFS transporter [Opitutae bacterium]MBT5379630.1 POT family MFS transporter [Opitutae bacterium]MBT6461612.1 POT family MFS transporter [Opitutae bacterium]MBT7853679.1 POT family MFS transporter [Opitutae bacterium]
MPKYLTAPLKSASIPKGIPYIIGNEAAERYSFYGMKAILVIFMTKYLMGQDGPDPMSDEEAKTWFHLFNSAVYFTPLLGAIVADVFFGKYKTIISLSIVYCLGHLALAIDESRLGLSVGLTLIAIGAGGIKPCVSAHVGDQFGKSNAPLLEKVFGWFYFSINLGAFASQIMTPILLDRFGPQIAFGVPGGLMLMATIVFWMGRNVFVHIPPRRTEFVKETFSLKGLSIIGRLCIIYLFVAMFWALFDQTGSSWVLQADKMDRNWLGIEWLPSQIGAINPVMIMVFIPIFSMLVYPAINRVFPLTPMRKISIGFFVAVPSFLIPGWIELQIANGELPNIIWQLLAYVFITAAEVFISITCLEFSYTQAPKSMKSLILGFFLMSVSLGNLFTAGVNHFILNEPPSFTPDIEGQYQLELIADDGSAKSSAMVSIQVAKEKPLPSEKKLIIEGEASPMVDAGRLVATLTGKTVRMYATASKGDSRGRFTYRWTFVNLPESSQLNDSSLQNPMSRNPQFVPDVEGEYDLQFSVKVGDGEPVTDLVKVIATGDNLPPVADAGEAQNTALGEVVKLNGDNTFDPNRDNLTYQWRIVSKPDNSKLTDKDLVGAEFPTQTSILKGANYYFFFSGMMFLSAILFIPVARWYKPQEYLQDEKTEPTT